MIGALEENFHEIGTGGSTGLQNLFQTMLPAVIQWLRGLDCGGEDHWRYGSEARSIGDPVNNPARQKGWI